MVVSSRFVSRTIKIGGSSGDFQPAFLFLRPGNFFICQHYFFFPYLVVSTSTFLGKIYGLCFVVNNERYYENL